MIERCLTTGLAVPECGCRRCNELLLGLSGQSSDAGAVPPTASVSADQPETTEPGAGLPPASGQLFLPDDYERRPHNAIDDTYEAA